MKGPIGRRMCGEKKIRVGGGSKQNVLPMRVKQSKPYVIHKGEKNVWDLCISAYNIYKCLKPP